MRASDVFDTLFNSLKTAFESFARRRRQPSTRPNHSPDLSGLTEISGNEKSRVPPEVLYPSSAHPNCRRRIYRRVHFPEKAKAQHVARGQALLKDKKFQEAALEFRSALQIDEKFADAHWGLANAYEGLQRYQEAFEEMKQVAELDANNLDVRVKLGNYYLLAGKQQSAAAISEAERMAKEVLQKNPNHIEGHILMGSVLFQQNHKPEAFAELNRAIEIDPQRVESYLSLARFYALTKDTDTAEATYKRAIAVNNSSAMAHYEYAKFLVQTNRVDAGRKRIPTRRSG